MEFHSLTTTDKQRSPLSVTVPLYFLLAGSIIGIIISNFLSLFYGLIFPSLLGIILLHTPSRRNREFGWIISGYLFFIFWSAWTALPVNEERISLPDREAFLTLKPIQHFHSDKSKYKLGIAKIVNAPQHLSYLKDQYCNYALKAAQNPPLNSEVLAKGILRGRMDSTNGFDQYLLNRQVYWSFGRGEFLKLIKFAPPLDQIRIQLLQKWERLLGVESNRKEATIMTSMILGQRWRLEESTEMLFKTSGTLHFFAISGLHVSTLALFLILALSLTRTPTQIKWILISIAIILYVWGTGGSPSSIRAGVMTICFFLFTQLRRQTSATSAFSLSALVILLFDPTQVWQLGFQLSYSVVGGILFFGIPFSNHLIKCTRDNSPQPYPQPFLFRIKETYKRLFIQTFSISLAAFFTSSPWIIRSFELWTPQSIPLNISLSPIILLAIFSGFLSLISGSIFGEGVADFWNHGSWILIRVIEEIIQSVESLININTQAAWKHPLDGPLLILLFLGTSWLIQSLHERKGKESGNWILIPIIIYWAYFYFRA